VDFGAAAAPLIRSRGERRRAVNLGAEIVDSDGRIVKLGAEVVDCVRQLEAIGEGVFTSSPMGMEQGSADTKLLWAMKLVEGLWRRLYSTEVTGRDPGPRRRVGAVMVLNVAPRRQGGGLQMSTIESLPFSI
jgi:hypothetical protein